VKLAQQPAAPVAKSAKSKTAAKATGPAEKVALASTPSRQRRRRASTASCSPSTRPAAASGKSTSDTDKLRVSLDYSSFNDVYGGNFGPRLRLVTLPACALTTPAEEVLPHPAARDGRGQRRGSPRP
jgi:hypothetical protein